MPEAMRPRVRALGGYGPGKPVAAQGEVGMATTTMIVLEDDLEGGPATETVQFSLGGKEYEIDLNAKNAGTFRSQLAPFVEHARRAGPSQRRGPARSAASRQRSAAIRARAKQEGIELSDRGRIPASVIVQYRANANAR